VASSITEFPLPNGTSRPFSITVGPDGNLWFTEGVQGEQGPGPGSIGTMTPSGAFQTFSLDTPDAPITITSGPDGNLWFTVQSGPTGAGDKIGKITPSGARSFIPVPGKRPWGITKGFPFEPVPRVWFTETSTPGSIARINTLLSDKVQEFAIPTIGCGLGRSPAGITAGPIGALWYADQGQVGAVSTLGDFEGLFPLPAGCDRQADQIVTGPDQASGAFDHNVWFTEYDSDRIGRITPGSPDITEFPVGAGPYGIRAGPDGNLWFTEAKANKIARITPDGALREFTIPTPDSFPADLVFDADGTLWFTENAGNKIGRLVLPPQLSLQNDQFKVDVTWAAPPQGTSGVGTPVPVASDTGAFWFFSPDNLELMIKVLGPVNGSWWVFFGSLTNVEFDLTVTQVSTGAVRTYHNPYGTQASVADTSAFASSSPPPGNVSSSIREVQGAVAGFDPLDLVQAELAPSRAPRDEAVRAACTPDAASLCLRDSRFRVQVAWDAPDQGTSGVGTAVPLTGDTGSFWFFSSNNLELVLKVLDGRAANGHFWVFYGALSDVEYTITVTDTQTGAVQTYHNPNHTLASFSDTSAF